jgi:hypothetical protein
MHEHAVLLNPADPLGTLVVGLGALGTAFTFVLAFRLTLWPGETRADHPKHVILREDR